MSRRVDPDVLALAAERIDQAHGRWSALDREHATPLLADMLMVLRGAGLDPEWGAWCSGLAIDVLTIVKRSPPLDSRIPADRLTRRPAAPRPSEGLAVVPGVPLPRPARSSAPPPDFED